MGKAKELLRHKRLHVRMFILKVRRVRVCVKVLQRRLFQYYKKFMCIMFLWFVYVHFIVLCMAIQVFTASLLVNVSLVVAWNTAATSLYNVRIFSYAVKIFSSGGENIFMPVKIFSDESLTSNTRAITT